MRSSRACTHCGNLSLWNVRQMQDSAFFRSAPLGEIDRVAPLETFICAGCGYTAWYSDADDELEEVPGQVVRVVDERLRCDDCDEEAHFLVAQFHEWAAEPLHGSVPLAVVRTGGWRDPVGQFAFLVCGGCGRSEWYAWGIGADAKLGKSDAAPCARCGGGERHVVRPLREAGGEPLPVVQRNGAQIGEFEVKFCGACGFSEWYARGIEQLRADGECVLHIQGERQAASPAAGGPYR
jgi:predicted nucleic-acid-binding Zn-ribbon protein